MSSGTAEYSQLIEIDAGSWVNAITFSVNSKFLISGGERVQVWRLKDGEQVATLPGVESQVWCIAVSKDDRWIAAGSHDGKVLVWDATTWKQVSAHKAGEWPVRDVDFSPDLTRLRLASSSDHYTATIWNARRRVQTLHHGGQWVGATKFSPQGNRIATASVHSVRVWDSLDGRLLVDINFKVRVETPRDLLWFNDHLFVKTEDDKIRQLDTSDGSLTSQWTVAEDYLSRMALPQHGKFLVHSARGSVTFWDTLTRTKLGFMPYNCDILSIAFSPHDHLLAVATEKKEIIVRALSLIKEPEVYIDSAALDAWKHGQLTNAEALLTAAILVSEDADHHALAGRALVRARMGQWSAALTDAKESIEIQPSVVGYIANSVALVGKGSAHEGFRLCDTASRHFHSMHVTLRLIKAVVMFMAGEHEDAMSLIDDLIAIVFWDARFHLIKAYMYLLLGNSHMEDSDYSRAIQSFEHARVELRDHTEQPPLIFSLISGWNFDDLAIKIQQRFCEALLAAGRMKEACESVMHMVDREGNMTEQAETRVSDFMEQCLSENNSHTSAEATCGNNTRETPHTRPLRQLLKEWARLKLKTTPWKDALAATTGFVLPRSTIYQVICERLETNGHVEGAVVCFHQLRSEVVWDGDGEQANWTWDFKLRCCKKLEQLGDIATNAREYKNAISQYTVALSLNPSTPQDLLVKRSKACAGKGEWNHALCDANELITLDPYSPLGYERKHAILHGRGDYDGATYIYEIMLSKMSQSSNPKVREKSRRYVKPQQMKDIIHVAIDDAIHDSPLVLINTESGRLCNKSEQAAAFLSMPASTKLISSMTTDIDHVSIKEEVARFYRYATLSHKWEENEPMYETVIKIMVYDLVASPAHRKLQMFCKTAREAGFKWAWSDTCCINQGDHVVLQEALVSMFKWYEHAALTIIFLRGVGRLAKRGALTRSIWNMRAWTLQEYHASKVVRFYTEDWTPYLGLDLNNHKDSPEIISEMEEATHISEKALMELRPGLDDIRTKLCLASTRQTTRAEDAAYSLFGIFSVSLPVVYGEGDKSLGRLLAQLLASSGDTSILAWTGIPGSFNSCLPASITVFRHPPVSHIPPPIANDEMRKAITKFHSLADHPMAARFYDRLNELPVPLFSGIRMKLSCLTFKLGPVSVARDGLARIWRARANVLGIVEIQTEENLSDLGSLYLIHPWIDFLLDRQPVGGTGTTLGTENASDDAQSSMPSTSPDLSNTASTVLQTRAARFIARLGGPFGGWSTTSAADTTSLQPPSTVSSGEKQTRVLRCLARLRQPFGALLVTQTRHNIIECRRVAAESLIIVQVKDFTPATLDRLIQGVRTLDVL